MRFEEPLRPFIRRLRLEAWIHAAFLSVSSGAVTAFFILLICRVFAIAYPFGLVIGLSVGIALAAAVVTYFVMFRIGMRQVLRRVDEAGLQDRVSMMYEQWGDTSYLAVRQREDTLRRLRAVKPRSIRMKLPLLTAILVFSLALTTIGVAALPPRTSRVTDTPIEDDYAIENDEVKRLITVIDKKVGELFPEDDFVGDRVNDIINDLKDAILDKDGNVRDDLRDEEKASEIDGAIGRIDDLIRETLVSATLGQLLVRMPETKPLGEALLSRKESDVNAALDEMFSAIPADDGMSARAEHLALLRDDLLGAIEASGAWEGNELVAALRKFADGLSPAVASLSDVFNTAKTEINRALTLEKEREAALEEIKKDMEAAIGDLMKDYESSDKHINPDLNRGDDSDKGKSDSDRPAGNPDTPGGNPAVPGGGADADTDFTYYDPILGKEVKLTAENIEAYKKRMDEAIGSGQYTEEQKNYFYNYYNTLMEQLKNRQ